MRAEQRGPGSNNVQVVNLAAKAETGPHPPIAVPMEARQPGRIIPLTPSDFIDGDDS